MAELTPIDDVDGFWPDHIDAFRRHPAAGKKKVLTFRGLYTAIFRTTSRFAHAEVDSLQANVRARDAHIGWPGEPRTEEDRRRAELRPV
jgi:hypothetical protein